ncbi:hypothetical protein BGW36DRAFT_369692 [Talaromyces proteolyticus]|uniref:S-adenosyl-L-methionine-dependent methyltransferase n=1 Tax=Talaromyces proteolyticus TaxID=1131652 RepID=A0AAD4Q2G1_9EURO|nr:uncharacterized protein BGW36DRAFT_369692 [Talaromyces proteolyticus]KAH8703652.1 hypothetical protein BGW36DRAFT_369692 [Talaromyces proteolyticus]
MSRSIKRAFMSLIGIHDELYGLDHAILNVTVPPDKLWMNMGYWKDTTSFPHACQALLDQVLLFAGLLSQQNIPAITPSFPSHSRERETTVKRSQYEQHAKIRLIDVGFGCGDQSLYLTRKLDRIIEPSETPLPESAVDAGNNGDGTTASNQDFRPLFDSYIGINITPSQVDIAKKRLLKASSEDHTSSLHSTPKVELFVADAGNPASWDLRLKEAVYSRVAHNTEQDAKPAAKVQTWLLALDTLYHFKPSRTPLFECAHRDMQASIMAFDLLLSESASLWDRFRLRLMCLVAGIPYSNFMTEKEYRAMLGLAGYEQDMIDMQNISKDVFAGIADYIRRRELELETYGMTVGKFKAPAKVFDWWARSGVVQGFVVIAHRT